MMRFDIDTTVSKQNWTVMNPFTNAGLTLCNIYKDNNTIDAVIGNLRASYLVTVYSSAPFLALTMSPLLSFITLDAKLHPINTQALLLIRSWTGTVINCGAISGPMFIVKSRINESITYFYLTNTSFMINMNEYTCFN